MSVLSSGKINKYHCLKYARIWVFTDPYFPVRENPYSCIFYVVYEYLTSEEILPSNKKKKKKKLKQVKFTYSPLGKAFEK